VGDAARDTHDGAAFGCTTAALGGFSLTGAIITIIVVYGPGLAYTR
jgi:hypothetical protein